jgi:hypothetical protein
MSADLPRTNGGQLTLSSGRLFQLVVQDDIFGVRPEQWAGDLPPALQPGMVIVRVVQRGGNLLGQNAAPIRLGSHPSQDAFCPVHLSQPKVKSIKKALSSPAKNLLSDRFFFVFITLLPMLRTKSEQNRVRFEHEQRKHGTVHGGFAEHIWVCHCHRSLAEGEWTSQP